MGVEVVNGALNEVLSLVVMDVGPRCEGQGGRDRLRRQGRRGRRGEKEEGTGG